MTEAATTAAEIYKGFRVAGMRAMAAYTAMYCAVRVAVFSESEIPNWSAFFRAATPAALADVRRAMSLLPAVR